MGYKNNVNILIHSFLIVLLSLVQFTHALWLPGDSLSSQSRQILVVTNGLEPVVLAPGVNVEVHGIILKEIYIRLNNLD